MAGLDPEGRRNLEPALRQFFDKPAAVVKQFIYQRIRIHESTPSGSSAIASYIFCASALVFCSYRLVSSQSLATVQLLERTAFAAASAAIAASRFANSSRSSRSCVQHFSENFRS